MYVCVRICVCICMYIFKRIKTTKTTKTTTDTAKLWAAHGPAIEFPSLSGRLNKVSRLWETEEKLTSR